MQNNLSLRIIVYTELLRLKILVSYNCLAVWITQRGLRNWFLKIAKIENNRLKGVINLN